VIRERFEVVDVDDAHVIALILYRWWIPGKDAKQRIRDALAMVAIVLVKDRLNSDIVRNLGRRCVER
jgi:hypothetical protein